MPKYLRHAYRFKPIISEILNEKIRIRYVHLAKCCSFGFLLQNKNTKSKIILTFVNETAKLTVILKNIIIFLVDLRFYWWSRMMQPKKKNCFFSFWNESMSNSNSYFRRWQFFSGNWTAARINFMKWWNHTKISWLSSAFR